MVEKYVQKVLDNSNEDMFYKKVEVVKKMLELNIDNRILN